MHVTVDLGFPSLVLAVCLVVVPVFGFVIRGKWQRAVARKEEIRRLLALASEEAAKAELENTLSYYGSLDGAVPMSVPSSLPYSSSSLRNGYQCAVCYCPTTMRCSRCKAVRYCSWKCQFIHWREGHKEECHPFSEDCHPFSEDYHINANGRTSSQKVALQEQQEVSNGRFENASVDTTSVDLNLNNSNSSTGHVKNDDNKDDRFANEEGTFTASESSGGSFSGFSTSPVHSGSSDDVSFGENSGSNETEGSEGYMSTDAGLDVLEHNFNEVCHSQPSSPKFGSLVDSIDSCNKSSVSNHSQHPSVDGRESKHAVADSSWQSSGAMYKNSTTKHGDGCSGFWGKTLDSVMTSLENVDDSACANLVGDRNWNKSHAEPLLHANPKSQSDVPSMQVQGSASKGTTLVSAVASKAVDRTALSEKPAVSDIEVMSFPPVSCEKSNQVVDDASGASDLSRSSEHKAVPSSSSDAHLFSSKKGGFLPIDALEVNSSASLPSERASFSVNESVSAPHKAKIRIQSTAPQSHLVPEKHDSSESGLTTSPSASISPSYVGGLKSSMLKAVDQLRGPKYGRCNDKGLFSYELFVKLYNSKKVEIKPFGLINCGNSCYANAVLQCLAFTPPLTAYFAQGLHSKKCVSKGWCFTCEFERLILKAKEGKYPLSPIGILSQLQHIGSQLSNGREEDAHEFLRYSIDTMQSVYLKEAGANSLASLQEETTLVGLTFGGYLHSKIKCLKCQYKSEQQERMMDLAIEIGGDIVKLEDALRQFTSSEILDGDNKYQCSRCKSKEKAKKKLTILEAPNVLTIALKRFQLGKFGKLNKSIQFPEILNLAPYMSGTSDKSPIYRLYGVIVHLDVMNAAFSGHYVCYVKDIQNKWFKVDDSTVTSVDLDRVLTKGAYMLLYSRCSPRAPRLIRNSIADLKNKSNPSRMTTKFTALKSRSMSPHLDVAHYNRYATTPESLASVESFYLKFHRLQKILEEDSSSDSFSFTSSNSDEGSCSTDSTRDSACADDLPDYVFGSSSSSWRNSSDSDTSSSSSSPLYSRYYSPASNLDGNVSNSPNARWSKIDRLGSMTGDGEGRDRQQMKGSSSLVNSEGKGGDPILHADDTIRPSRKLIGSSSSRETDTVKLGYVNPLNDVKSGVSFRRSISERTD